LVALELFVESHVSIVVEPWLLYLFRHSIIDDQVVLGLTLHLSILTFIVLVIHVCVALLLGLELLDSIKLLLELSSLLINVLIESFLILRNLVYNVLLVSHILQHDWISGVVCWTCREINAAVVLITHDITGQ